MSPVYLVLGSIKGFWAFATHLAEFGIPNIVPNPLIEHVKLVGQGWSWYPVLFEVAHTKLEPVLLPLFIIPHPNV